MSFGQSASLSVAKIADHDPVSPGDTIVYTLTVSNEGPDDAATVVLDDPLPAGVTFTSLASPMSWNCTTPAIGANGTVQCTIATVSPGTDTFTITAQIGNGVAQGSVLTNTATISSATSDPHAADNSASVNSNVAAPAAAGVSMTKSGAPSPVTAGTDLTYTITVTNGAVGDLDTATLTDALPPGTTFGSLTPAQGWNCTTPASGATGSITCSTIALAQGTVSTFTLVVHVGSGVTNSINNMASLAYSSGGRDGTTNASALTPVDIVNDLSVNKSDSPDPVIAGNNITYTITVNNAGPSNAPSATLSDPLPANTTFVSIVAPAGWSCIGTTCTNPSFAPGAPAVFTLTVTANLNTPDGTVITNTATVSTTGDSNSGNDSATSMTTVALYTTSTSINAPTVTYNANGTVTVTVSSASQTPTGNVTLSVDGGAPLTQTLAPAGGFTASATFTLPSPSAGTHTLQANYALQPPFRASSASGSLIVNPASSTTTLNVTPPAAVTGQTLTLTATVGSASGTPTGTVQFFVDANPLGAPVALSGGSATTTTSLNAGPHTLSATYSGDTNFASSSSGTSNITIAPAATTTTITTNLVPPSVVNVPLNISFAVAVTAPGSGLPTGTVTLSDGAGTTCSATLPVTNCSMTFTSTGTKTITASYSGDANFLASNSAPVTHSVVTQAQLPALDGAVLVLLALALALIALKR